MSIFRRALSLAQESFITPVEDEEDVITKRAIDLDELATTSTTLPDIPTGQYRKTRHQRSAFVPSEIFGASPSRPILGSVESGGSPTQPAAQIVNGPLIDFEVTDIQKSGYRWTGFFGFDNAEYDFVIHATDKFLVKLDGVVIIDDYDPGPTRTRSETISVIAGTRQVTIEWNPDGFSTMDFNFTRVSIDRWTSCVDGIEREGDPPVGWVKTSSGCFKPPLSDEDIEAVDLLDVVSISPDAGTRIERAYIKGSGTALSAHRMMFLNRSTNMSINVGLGGPKPVRFVTAFIVQGDVGVGGLPASSFTLAPRETKEVDVLFVAGELDSLPEGLIRSDILASVTAGTITISKDSDDQIDIGEPLPSDQAIEIPPIIVDLPPPPPPTPTWRDCSGTTEVVRDGFPPSDFILRSDGCYVPPQPVVPPVTLDITATEWPSQFDGITSIARANLRPAITAGRSAWSWQWNFDVNREGPGSGNTTAQDPVVSWRMNAQDLRNMSSRAQTTRVIEAVATRRAGTFAGQIVRQRLTVIFDDVALLAPLKQLDEGESDEF